MNAAHRRAAATPRKVRSLVFDKLPQRVRDRLVHGIVHGAPEPLVAAPSGRAPLALRASVAALVVALAALAGLCLWGFGDLDGRYGQQPGSFAALYGALSGVALGGAAAVALLRKHLRGAPFASGHYLFALDLVEAAGGRLTVTSLETLRDVEERDGVVTVSFEDGHEVAFALAKGDDPAERARKARRAIEAAKGLALPKDQGALEGLDPFFEVRLSDDWDAAEAGTAAPSRRPVIAVLAALSVLEVAPAGYGMLRARNALSDDAMFEEAVTNRVGGTPVRLKLARYAQRGSRHRDEVEKRLAAELGGDPVELGRVVAEGGPLADAADDALFALAQKQNNIGAYNAYLEHGRRHADVVKKDLLPEADWVFSQKVGLVGALFSFVRRYPGSKHEDEAWKKIHAMYRAGRDNLRARQKLPPDAQRYLEALLSFVEERADTRVTVLVTMAKATSVEQADQEYAAKYGARYLRAASRFSSSALDELSRNIREAVANELGYAFPGGLVEVSESLGDEGRPILGIDCTPIATAAAMWGSPDGKDEGDVVTPEVGFLVEVAGVVRTLPYDTRIGWRLKIEDETEGKMEVATEKGASSPERMLDDAFARFFEDVPKRIAASFRAELIGPRTTTPP